MIGELLIMFIVGMVIGFITDYLIGLNKQHKNNK